ncbi:MAG: methionyl-tRNA formyltransferase [Pseudomonadales bacterium]|nr:methionyl-tRNA formyltransferase [Pseudomonadales bacterium]
MLTIGFAGTPVFAAEILSGLINANFCPVIVLTQPDRAKGRGKKTTSNAVKQIANAHDIQIEQPATLRGECGVEILNALAAKNLDVLVVAAYGLFLPQEMLQMPRFGCLNVHASLLPKWRGAAPIERSIMNGDLVSGVSIMHMDEGMDTGPVYRSYPCDLSKNETGDSLHNRLAKIGISAITQCLDELPTLVAHPQDNSLASLAPKLTPRESVISWHEPAQAIERKIRALYSRQPAYSFIHNERVRILSATAHSDDISTRTSKNSPPGTILKIDKSGCNVATGDGVLKILIVQLSRGKGKPMPIASAINGFPQLFGDGHFQNEAK